MASPILMTEEQYLRTGFEPDAEFVDGVIEERNAGEEQHSQWQAVIAGFLFQYGREWNIRVRPELRTQTGERRYRVPDIAILDASLEQGRFAVQPPLAVFEILSPEDRLARLLVRLADFEQMGIPAIYLIDPVDNVVFRFESGKLQPQTTLSVADRTVLVQDLIDQLW